ncbi:MAG: hypothetical protein JEZ09_04355 [Salinivirgaceae bacterium]|nr:hypothetical protein [Salinivirgaceae bacterium]
MGSDKLSHYIDILNKNTVRVVISDKKVPEMTGVELLDKIKIRFSDIPPN